MKRHKYWLLIGIAVLFALSACMQTPPSSAVVSETSSIVNSVVNSAETTFNLIKQYDENALIVILSKHAEDGISSIMAVFEYPSPDKTQKFIEVKAIEGEPDSWSGDGNFVFLNDFDHFFYRYSDYYQESVGAVWIDNDTVAIGAEVIVNLKTGERKNIERPVVNNENSGFVELRMRSGLYIKELDSLIYLKDYDHVTYMLQYSLKDGIWTELFQRETKGEFIHYYIHFKRENENEVSFNIRKDQRLSFNFYTKEIREIPYVGNEISFLDDWLG